MLLYQPASVAIEGWGCAAVFLHVASLLVRIPHMCFRSRTASDVTVACVETYLKSRMFPVHRNENKQAAGDVLESPAAVHDTAGGDYLLFSHGFRYSSIER